MKKLKKILKVAVATIILLLLGILLLFGHRDIPLEKLKAKYTNEHSAFITIDDMKVHYRDEGDKTDSIPLVLIHGTGSSLHTYDAWTENLKATHRVIRMDLPAFGLTGPFPDRNYSMERYTAFLHEFLSTLSISKCVVAGNSLGGEIAWNYALMQPDVVHKLILIDAAGYPDKAQSVPIAFTLAQMPVLNKALTIITPRFLARASVENVFADKTKVTETLVSRYFELTLREGNRQALVDRFRMKKDTSAYRQIRNITQRTLVLWGAQDLLCPVKSAYQFHADLRNDTLVILDQMGHTPMEESPDESLDVVRSFLSEQ